MKLVPAFALSDGERQHACSIEQALEHVGQALQDRQPIEGLAQLRASLMVDIDAEVLVALEQGDWTLVMAEADAGGWAVPVRHFDQRVLALMKNPPPQPVRTPRLFRLVESFTGEPLAQRDYLATVEGASTQRKTDGEGIAHLFLSSPVQLSFVLKGG